MVGGTLTKSTVGRFWHPDKGVSQDFQALWGNGQEGASVGMGCSGRGLGDRSYTAAGKVEREDWVLRPRVLQGLRGHKSYLFSMIARQFYDRSPALIP